MCLGWVQKQKECLFGEQEKKIKLDEIHAFGAKQGQTIFVHYLIFCIFTDKKIYIPSPNPKQLLFASSLPNQEVVIDRSCLDTPFNSLVIGNVYYEGIVEEMYVNSDNLEEEKIIEHPTVH